MSAFREISRAADIVNASVKLVPMKLAVGFALPCLFMVFAYLPSVLVFQGLLAEISSAGGFAAMLRDPAGALLGLGSSALLSSLLLWIGLLGWFYCYMVALAGVAGIMAGLISGHLRGFGLGNFIAEGRARARGFMRYGVVFASILLLYMALSAFLAWLLGALLENLPEGAEVLAALTWLSASAMFLFGLVMLLGSGLMGMARMVYERTGPLRSLLEGFSCLMGAPHRANAIVLVMATWVLAQPAMAVLVAAISSPGGSAGYVLGLLAAGLWIFANAYMGNLMLAVALLGLGPVAADGRAATSGSSSLRSSILSA